MSKSAYYGFPNVTNPNDFIPDPESSTPAEMAAHKTACANFGKPDYEPNKGCFSTFSDDGQLLTHVTRTSWGLGTNLISTCDGCGEPQFDDPLMTCHECGGPEFCVVCWPEHEKGHDS